MQELNRVPDQSKAYDVAAFIVRNSHLFVMKHPTTHLLHPNAWGPVTAPLLMAETLYEGLARAIKDQTGWDIDQVLDCVHENEWKETGPTHHEFFFVVTVKGDPAYPLVPNHSREYYWVATPDDAKTVANPASWFPGAKAAYRAATSLVSAQS